ncbi:hypothetical protein PLEOSDRAFT_1088830 [Pleurotus ostreatus PC15]|uniref:Uncharacterized protein n=1 Tax=Pleurotus ostreatus (strain PC15) TaxID=1137138 RepID=A0A067NU39_PLEO1|nr:hypothetical protein PLEOSDRAFT_1088830 [Pleurotus ostreatus PC15]
MLLNRCWKSPSIPIKIKQTNKQTHKRMSAARARVSPREEKRREGAPHLSSNAHSTNSILFGRLLLLILILILIFENASPALAASSSGPGARAYRSDARLDTDREWCTDFDFAAWARAWAWAAGARWGSSSDCVRRICVRDAHRAPCCRSIADAEKGGLCTDISISIAIDIDIGGLGEGLHAELTRGRGRGVVRCAASHGVSTGGAAGAETARNGSRKYDAKRATRRAAGLRGGAAAVAGVAAGLAGGNHALTSHCASSGVRCV